MQICIVRLSALGDVLMLVPLIRRLQKSIPDVKITWVISKPAFYLVEGMDGVSFILIDKPKGLKDYWQFRKQVKDRHFDVLLATQASLRANLLYPLIKAKRKIGYDKARAKDAHTWFVKEQISPGQDHTLEGFLKFAVPLGIKEDSVSWDMPVQAEDYQWAKQYIDPKRKTLLINPAASKAERSWVISRYIELIHEVQSRWQLQVILTGGPTPYDKEVTEKIEKETNDVLNLAGKSKPKQLLALIDLADIMLCPDTGPAHMAAAMDTKVVALHAVTNPDISGPYTYRQLAVNYYPQAVEKILKIPLSQSWGKQVHDEKAMQLIPVEAVLERLTEIIEA
jgi:heptosyltransferase I